MPGGLSPPLSVMLSWPERDLISPERREYGLVITVAVLYTLTVLTVIARLWARIKITRNTGIDDWLILATMVPLTGLAATACVATRLYGFGMHVWDLSIEQLVASRKSVLVIEACYLVTCCLTKISILLFYRRLASGSLSKYFIWAVWASIAFVGAYTGVFMITIFLVCYPIDSFWNKVDPEWLVENEGMYRCQNEGANLVASAVFSIVQDVIACALPAVLFWNLQLPPRQKIALAGIFGVGIFLCVTAVLRIVYIHQIYYQTYDVTWVAYDAWIWTNIEALVAVICASAAALKVFFGSMFKTPPTIFHHFSRKNSDAAAPPPLPSVPAQQLHQRQQQRQQHLQQQTTQARSPIRQVDISRQTPSSNSATRQMHGRKGGTLIDQVDRELADLDDDDYDE